MLVDLILLIHNLHMYFFSDDLTFYVDNEKVGRIDSRTESSASGSGLGVFDKEVK